MRRVWVAALVLILAVLPAALVAEAQTVGKVYRIGFLRRTSPEPAAIEAFRQGLRELGYVEGQNVVIEQRYAHGAHEQLSGLARELLQLPVDVLVVDGTLTVRAAREVAGTTPIIFTMVPDPVSAQLVASLARPGGTVTGVTLLGRELIPKRLQLLVEIVPTARVGVLYNPHNTQARHLEQLAEMARSLAVELRPVEAPSPTALEAAFTTMRRQGVLATLIWNDAMFFSQRARIVELAAQHRLPAVYEDRQFAEVGGLMTYGPNEAANFRRAAAFVDKILKGTKPADLPVEEPTKVELVINMKTVKALGLTIPPAVLARADEIIQ
jgi:putative tryptophan/tyrosine transport system substrate-binding protein